MYLIAGLIATSNPQFPNLNVDFFFGVTFSGFCVRLIELIWAYFIVRRDPGSSFAIYDLFHMWEMMSPIYSFVAFLICTVGSWRVTFSSILWSIFPMALLAFFFDWWLIDSMHIAVRAAEISPGFEFKTFDFAVYGGTIFDFYSLIISNLLLVWQILTLVRFFRLKR